MPTLLTRMSSPESSRVASATTRSGSPGCERSATTCATSPTPGASRRPHVTTRAPSATSSRTVSSPMPPVEPVTRQRFPSSPRSKARLAYPRAHDDRPGPARRDRLEPRQPLPGPRRRPAQLRGARAGARARRSARRRVVLGRVHQPAPSSERERCTPGGKTRDRGSFERRAQGGRRRRLVRAHDGRGRSAFPGRIRALGGVALRGLVRRRDVRGARPARRRRSPRDRRRARRRTGSRSDARRPDPHRRRRCARAFRSTRYGIGWGPSAMPRWSESTFGTASSRYATDGLSGHEER